MEQKKTLWIIAAVGVFLIVCFGVAYLIINNPNDNYEGTTTTITPKENRNIDNGWSSPSDLSQLQNNTENNTSENINANDVYVVANNATVVGLNTTEGTTIDLMTLGNGTEPYVSANDVVREKNTEDVVSVPTNEIKITNEATEYYTGSPSEAAKNEKNNSVKQYSQTPKVEQKNTTKASTTKTNTATATTKTNTGSKTTVSTPAQTKPVTRYWVQVASYQNKKTAENARTILNDNKIISDIFTYQDNSNNLFYRVRVGPYTTKSEAEYWMSKIIQIKDFNNAQSYVTSTVDK